MRCPSVCLYGDSEYSCPRLELLLHTAIMRDISASTVKRSPHLGYEQEGIAPSVPRSYHVRIPMAFVRFDARHARDIPFLLLRQLTAPILC